MAGRNMLGKTSRSDHICHLCQGKAAKRLWRQVTKRAKRREERQWRRAETP